ncbi:MAG: PhnD/SsuA/transferrin family substrate-binding protein [Candidatus Thiodiazotropha sp.]
MNARFAHIHLICSCLILYSTLVGSAPIPERYQDDLPDVGYFGRMDKVLYASDATDTTIATNMLIKQIFSQIGMQAVIKTYKDGETLRNDLSGNRIDAVFVNIFDYFRMEHLVNTDYLYSLTIGPNPYQKTLLITQKKDRIRKIEDLQGKSISIPRGHFLGNYYLDVELLKRGLPDSTKFFSNIEETVDINSAVIDLFFGKTDCALVTEFTFKLAAEMNSQINNNLEILLASKEMVPQIIALNKNISPPVFQRVDSHLIKIHKNPRVRKLLTLFRASNIVKLNLDNIKESRRLFSEYHATAKKAELNHNVHHFNSNSED